MSFLPRTPGRVLSLASRSHVFGHGMGLVQRYDRGQQFICCRSSVSTDVSGLLVSPASIPWSEVLPKSYRLIQSPLGRFLDLPSAGIDRVPSRTDRVLGRSDLHRNRLQFHVRFHTRVYVGLGAWLPLRTPGVFTVTSMFQTP